MQIPVIERDVDRSELYIADEVFLSGTACQIAYFSKIDNHLIGDDKIGTITRRIQQMYFNAVHNQEPKYKEWLVKVSS